MSPTCSVSLRASRSRSAHEQPAGASPGSTSTPVAANSALFLVLLIAGGAGGFYWWKSLQSQLPPGIFSGNGRIEADEIDISTKFAGRIATIAADEGYMVKAGQVVATMDTRDLEASLKKSKAQVELSNRAIDEAKANVAQLESQGNFLPNRNSIAPPLSLRRAFKPKRCWTSAGNNWMAPKRRCRPANSGKSRPGTRSRRQPTMLSSIRSTSRTTRWSRRVTAASNIGLPTWAKLLPAGGQSLRHVGYRLCLHGRLPANRGGG